MIDFSEDFLGIGKGIVVGCIEGKKVATLIIESMEVTLLTM